MFQDTSTHTNEPVHFPRHSTMVPKARPAKKAKRREVNYKSTNRKGTEEKQRLIRELLASGLPFTVRAIGVALGISRQLALYHVKKMAATSQLVMMLEPCERNGGLQFRCWTQETLEAFYVSRAFSRRAA